MARNRNAPSETEEPVAAAATTEAAPATDEAKVDARYKKVTDPETGETVNRADFIRKCCTPKEQGGKGMSRSETTKLLRELTGDKNFRYQIVFAATKGIKGVKASDRGKKPEEAGAEGAEASAE
jgi:hypothetical protein